MKFWGREFTRFLLTLNATSLEDRRQTVRDKLHSREGKSPDHQLRSQILVKWLKKWKYTDNQEVGLEAVIL